MYPASEVLARRRPSLVTGAAIKDKLLQYSTLLQLMNSTFGFLSVITPTEEEIKEAENAVNETMKLWRELGISVTTKAHLLESHAIFQMRNLRGLGDKREDWIESGHQVGLRDEARTRRMRSFRLKQENLLKVRDAAQHPLVRDRQAAVTAASKRKFTDTNRAKSARSRNLQKQQVKSEKRQKVVNETMMIE
mmetsp:Transcript_2441/g.3843  ORF Transcript_2441/g.3843 Transcript_2441/m.3843 type:complete len:192 (-) Transcript_2441:217-792(-)